MEWEYTGHEYVFWVIAGSSQNNPSILLFLFHFNYHEIGKKLDWNSGPTDSVAFPFPTVPSIPERKPWVSIDFNIDVDLKEIENSQNHLVFPFFTLL